MEITRAVHQMWCRTRNIDLRPTEVSVELSRVSSIYAIYPLTSNYSSLRLSVNTWPTSSPRPLSKGQTLVKLSCCC